MKKILVIGSTVVDVLIEVEALPTSSTDMHTRSQQIMIGGCAYNVHKTLDYLAIPHTLFSPVGTGLYGEYIRGKLNEEDCKILLNSDEENGCCYCFVEPNGERSFVSHHGAEYRFKSEWFDKLDCRDYQSAYLCGLELEESTGGIIVDFLCKHQELDIFFAPGPRVQHIDKSLIERLISRGVSLHLNADELQVFTGVQAIDEGLMQLHQKTKLPIIVTMGKEGAKIIANQAIISQKALPTKVVNTNGAGDSHIAAVMAGLHLNKEWKDILREANCVAATVVASKSSYIK